MKLETLVEALKRGDIVITRAVPRNAGAPKDAHAGFYLFEGNLYYVGWNAEMKHTDANVLLTMMLHPDLWEVIPYNDYFPRSESKIV